MRKLLSLCTIFIFGGFFFLFISPTHASAATLCWKGTTTDWTVASNWVTSTGAAATAAPGTADVATFDTGATCSNAGTNNNANITAAISVLGINIASNYKGTITQNTNTTITITVGTSGWIQNSGTFTAGTGNITINGSFTHSGSTFDATTNSSTVIFAGGSAYTISGSTTFTNLQFTTGCVSPFTATISTGTTLTVVSAGTLTLTGDTCGGNTTTLNGGTIAVQGNVTVNSSGSGWNGNTVVQMTGSGSQTITGATTGTLSTASIPSLTLSDTGTVSFVNTIAITGSWINNTGTTGGTLSLGTSTIIFTGNSAYTISGSTTFNNLQFTPTCANPFTETISTGTALTVASTLTLTGNPCAGNPISLNGDTITVQGNLTTVHSGSDWGGNVAITLSGSANQTITHGATNFPTGTVTINKASGTVTLASAFTLSGSGQALVFSSGILSTGAYNLTVNGVMTVGGTLTQGSGVINAGTFITTSGGIWNNQSTGGMIVGSGGVTNYGKINFGSQQTCGGTDNITITSSSGGTARNWSGSGIYNFYDIAVTDQNESPYRGRVIAFSSTNNGNSNFNILSTCPSPASFYWKMDEGTGTTLNDSSNNAPNGTANSDSGTLGGTTIPTWQTEDQCVSGKCLYFDGTTSKVTATKIVNNIQSVSIWVRPISVTAGTLMDMDGGTHKITVSSGAISATGFTSPTVYVGGVVSSTLVANKWQLVEVTTGTAFNTSASFTLATDGTTFTKGFFDEVKFYSYQRTAGQVQSDFAGQKDSIGGNLSGLASTAALNQGLVGYWKMDETSGNASDSSGNGYTLTNNNITTFVAGKFGNASSYNGTTQYFSTASTIAGVQTLAFWVNPASNTNNYINFNGATYITSSAGTIAATGTSAPSIYVNGVLNGTITANSWNQVIITTNTSVSASTFEVGRANGSYLSNTSTMDEVRLYNRTLSPTEVSQLYNFAPGPTGYWKFDEGSGTSVSDSSGNANTGTWNGTGSSHWTPGKYGRSGNFNGTDDYISVSNTLSGVETFSFWTNPTSTTANLAALSATAYITSSAGTVSATGFTAPSIYVNDILNGAITANSWNYISVTTATGISASTITFGKANGSFLTGKIDEVRIYNYARTQKQIVEDMNAGHPSGGSPIGSAVGYWKFNEGFGATANNSGNAGSTINGTLTCTGASCTNPTWTNSGKYGRALTFGATNNYINIPNNSAVSLTNFTISAWIYPTSIFGGMQPIVAKGSNFELRLISGGQIQLVNGATGSGPTSNKTIPQNTWAHIVGSYDGTTTKIYINGMLDTSVTNASFTTNTNALTIGTRPALDLFFIGSIDEVKLYSYVLTDDEVKIDMNRGSSEVLGALSQSNGSTDPGLAGSQEYCIPGDSTSCAAPVGRWDFEEGSGTSVNDSSGNANTGTWNGTGTAHWVPGKYGSAGNFNGTNDYVSVSTTVAGVQTFSFWTNPTSTTANLAALSATAYITSSAGTVSATGFTAPSIYVNDILNGAITANSWNYISVTTATGISASTITFGKANGSFLTGKIDNAEIFNYARSAAQIAWDYNRGAPIGWWKFDECQGTTANDSSGNSNTGTITIGTGAGTGHQDSAGNCTTNAATAWYNGRIGKYNASLNFDGIDDDATVSNIISGVRSVAFWVKPTITSPNMLALTATAYISASSGTVSATGFTSPTIYVNGIANGTLSANSWNHVVVTTGTGISASAITFAKANGVFMSGQLDDIRMYNYALTKTQVPNLYNQGSAIRYGPATGAP